MYEPFPVESSLHGVLPDHLNAEIVAGTIQTKQDALDYITWTYFFRRLIQNPTYYGLDGVDETNLNQFLTETVNDALYILEDSGCIEIDDDDKGKHCVMIVDNFNNHWETTTFGFVTFYFRHSGDCFRTNCLLLLSLPRNGAPIQ